jgi:hypothetical protein
MLGRVQKGHVNPRQDLWAQFPVRENNGRFVVLVPNIPYLIGSNLPFFVATVIEDHE